MKSRTIIPASPGFFVVQPLSGPNGEPANYSLMPVVAWKVGHYDPKGELVLAEPVTIEIFNARDTGIMLPNGDIVFPCDTHFFAGNGLKKRVIEHMRVIWELNRGGKRKTGKPPAKKNNLDNQTSTPSARLDLT